MDKKFERLLNIVVDARIALERNGIDEKEMQLSYDLIELQGELMDLRDLVWPDAQRYRWLRENGDKEIFALQKWSKGDMHSPLALCQREELDRVVDEHIAKNAAAQPQMGDRKEGEPCLPASSAPATQDSVESRLALDDVQSLEEWFMKAGHLPHYPTLLGLQRIREALSAPSSIAPSKKQSDTCIRCGLGITRQFTAQEICECATPERGEE